MVGLGKACSRLPCEPFFFPHGNEVNSLEKPEVRFDGGEGASARSSGLGMGGSS